MTAKAKHARMAVKASLMLKWSSRGAMMTTLPNESLFINTGSLPAIRKFLACFHPHPDAMPTALRGHESIGMSQLEPCPRKTVGMAPRYTVLNEKVQLQNSDSG
jgi:hypothetical protein